MADYSEYRVRLRRARWPLREGDRLWGKRVYSDRPTYYASRELHKRFRWSWRLQFFMWRDDDGVQIEGSHGDGRWESVSPWLIKERRALRGAFAAWVESIRAVSESADKVAERMMADYRGANLRRARGEAAWHLVGHLRYGWGRAAKVMLAMDYVDVEPDDVRKHAENGRVRMGEQKKECSFCPHPDSVPL